MGYVGDHQSGVHIKLLSVIVHRNMAFCRSTELSQYRTFVTGVSRIVRYGKGPEKFEYYHSILTLQRDICTDFRVTKYPNQPDSRFSMLC
jgi:hypothetical protein